MQDTICRCDLKIAELLLLVSLFGHSLPPTKRQLYENGTQNANKDGTDDDLRSTEPLNRI